MDNNTINETTFEKLTAKTIAEYILIGRIPREKLIILPTQQQHLVKTHYNKLNQLLCVQMAPL